MQPHREPVTNYLDGYIAWISMSDTYVQLSDNANPIPPEYPTT